MGINLTWAKIIYAAASLVGGVLGSIFGFFFVKESKYSDLNSLFIGGFLLSISIVRLAPSSEHINQYSQYPFSMLISIFVFTFLTLFNFIRDNLAIQNPEPEISTQSLLSHDNQDNASKNDSQFVLKDSIQYILFYISMVLLFISDGLLLTTLSSIDEFNSYYCIQPFLKLFETYSMSKLMLIMPIPNYIFWTLSLIADLIEPILIAVPININSKFQKIFSAVCSSVALGMFFYFGGSYVHNGWKEPKPDRGCFLPFLFLFIGFLIPCFLHAFEEI